MKRYHFIGGLPRSGSTLLVSILNQNPQFHADISNPLARFVKSIITDTYVNVGDAVECTEQKRIRLIQGLVENYHEDDPGEVMFNTNRGWPLLAPMMDPILPDAKFICTVRSIPWIIDSFERLFRSNPFTLPVIFNEQERETVYTRSASLMSEGKAIRFSYDCLKELAFGPHKHKMMIVEYEQLTQRPEQTMRALYQFIGEPYYAHDFDNVEANYDEYDADTRFPGLHAVKKKVQYLERPSILPPDVWNQFSNLEFWK